VISHLHSEDRLESLDRIMAYLEKG
jgi:hypothetical protein